LGWVRQEIWLDVHILRRSSLARRKITADASTRQVADAERERLRPGGAHELAARGHVAPATHRPGIDLAEIKNELTDARRPTFDWEDS